MSDKNLPIPPPPKEPPSRDRLFSFGSSGSPPVKRIIYPPNQDKK